MSMREALFAKLPRPPRVDLAGRRVLVLGLGDSGLSAAKWIAREGGLPRVADTRASPPRAAALVTEVPGAELIAGGFAPELLEGIELVCVSPGLSLSEAPVQDALARGIPVLGDIELFAWKVRAERLGKVVAVTGTNGKTTVTSLLGHLLRAAGIDCEVAGNIGPAALEALIRRLEEGRVPAVWALELSSYQLETTFSLAPDAAVMLNLSEDHFERYANLEEYGAAKARIFQGSGVQVLNRDDPHSAALARPGRECLSFGLGTPPGPEDFGLLAVGGQTWLAQGGSAILEAHALQIHGWHNASNALAAAALARALGVPLAALAKGLAGFRGLPHRLQRVREHRGVTWYDDSKGTNVGATIAALGGIAGAGGAREPRHHVLLIAGGEGKGQDFGALAAPVAECARRVLLIGRDAGLIERALAPSGVLLERCASLEDAVASAAAHALPGDVVLLSPACASFDMFRDYQHRGEVFAASVLALGH